MDEQIIWHWSVWCNVWGRLGPSLFLIAEQVRNAIPTVRFHCVPTGNEFIPFWGYLSLRNPLPEELWVELMYHTRLSGSAITVTVDISRGTGAVLEELTPETISLQQDREALEKQLMEGTDRAVAFFRSHADLLIRELTP